MKKRICSLFLTLVMVAGMLPTAAFAAAGETALAAAQSEEDYTYTEQDESQNPGETGESGVEGDVSTDPDDTETVPPDTEQEANEDDSQSDASVQDLLSGIAAGYVDHSDEWVVMDMAAYEDTNPDAQFKTSDAAKQAYIDAAIASLIPEDGEEVGETTYAKAVLILQSIGADPQTLYPENSSVSISAVDGLKSIASHDSSAWVAPYTLAALSQGDYDAEELEQSIVSAVLDNQTEDGYWEEWGDSIQTTSNMIAGLSFYYGTDEEVAAAVDQAVAYLSTAQKEDGSFDAYGYGADSNTAAMVVIALCSVGINPDTDERFVKNGTSALDVLLSFALSDNSGFGYQDNTTVDDYATEQGFRALIAASEVMETGKTYNVYDFSANEVIPAYASESQSGGGNQEGGSSSDGTMTVSFELKTHQATWIEKHDVTVGEDATVADVFYQELDSREEFSYVDNNGYISSITYNDTTWAAFDAGPNSGWKYMVNGVAPSVGMRNKYLEDGDEIVWYYVTDYTEDTDRDEDNYKKEEAVSEMPFTDVENHWACDAIQYVYERELMSGTSETAFSPDLTTSRGMIVTILYRLEGNPVTSGELSFVDVSEEMYYTDAVKWAVTNGIAAGYGDGLFGPDDPITREQLATILYRYTNFKGYDVTAEADLTQFVDAGEIHLWSLDALEWAHAENLISGTGNNILDPQGDATRAQAAVVLMRYLENVVK